MIREAVFALTLAAGSLGLCLLPASAEAAEPPPVSSIDAQPVEPVVATVADLTPEAQAEADELAALGAREAAAPQLQTFEGGGDTIYISSGVVVLVLVIVILVIIL